MRTILLDFSRSLCLTLPLAFFTQTMAIANSVDPVATVAGQPISEQELLDTVGPQQLMQLRNQEYQTKTKALESLIRLKLV